jgi:hypothetical protein
MHHEKNDIVIGALVVLCVLVFYWFFFRLEVLARLIAGILDATLAIQLWSTKSRKWKVVAVIAMPSILLQYLLPKKFRSAISILPANVPKK